ncbi:tail fiber assembly protein [Pseudomonas sp. D1-3]
MQTSAPAIYHYSGVTGELLGSGVADPDPMDADNWLIPANATITEPPALQAGHTARWLGQTWELIEDNRGPLYSTTSGALREHTELGPLPAGSTRQPMPGQHYAWNGTSWAFDEQSARIAFTSASVLERNRLQAEATSRIAPLQDAVEYGEATEAEQAELDAWKRYRIALNRVVLNAYPGPIQWPTPPA